ncbi:MAG: hypothetical protein Q8M20_02625 [Rhodocyclaceae bacterium]|nr:hypothetical protein [Rhodocyclaceae bacterium]MDZ4213276.1 hypothetical protein [Rhodocyclaceae bacterium]
MRKIQQRLLPYAFSALALGLMAGCASQQTTPAAAPKAEAPKVEAAKTATVDNYFLIYHENGRIYPIADAKNYLEFLHTGELIFTRTRVGAGPDGATLVFGIEKNETSDLTKPAKAELFFDGKYEPTGPFYGEIIRDGRFLVFGSWHDFKDYLKNKEITFTFTEVGTGPKGETVIYALNKNTVKEGRPVKLAEQFKNLHKIK